MKKFYFFLCMLLIASSATAQSNQSYSSCLPEGITFSTQADIDNFQANYPGCTEIEGGVNISGSNIINLNGLSVLTSIGGDLQVKNNPGLTSLAGLNNLASIGGDLEFHQNDSLSSIAALGNLNFIGGNIQIGYSSGYGNPLLASLTGLEGLNDIPGNLFIGYSDALVDLTGLENLASVGGDFSLYALNHLSNLDGLNSLAFIGGNFEVSGNYSIANPALTTLAGAESLAAIEGSLLISNNYALVSLSGLDNLVTVLGNVEIGGSNQSLQSLSGLESLSSIAGSLRIENNDQLNDMTGLNSLASIGGDLLIKYNWFLENLSGLNSLAFIGGRLGISNNHCLTSLSGIENIAPGSITDLWINTNSALTNCEVESLCAYLASPNGSVDIFWNSNGCNNPAEVANSCGTTLPCLPYGNYRFYYQNDIDNFQTYYPGCTALEGNVTVGPGSISNLNGLNVVTSIGGYCDIAYNNALTNLIGLESLGFIGGSLDIAFNNALINLAGLEGLGVIGGSLDISSNNALTNLIGLESLGVIGGSLHIGSNNALTNLAGLESLGLIGGSLSIGSNPALTSLTGLDDVIADSLNELYITSNTSLSECAVKSICDYLTGHYTQNIYSNASGCNSYAEVDSACVYLSEYEMNLQPGLTIHPNPACKHFTIETPTTPDKNTFLTIYNINGQQILKQQITEPSTVIDIESLPAGIYIMRVTDERTVKMAKIIRK